MNVTQTATATRKGSCVVVCVVGPPKVLFVVHAYVKVGLSFCRFDFFFHFLNQINGLSQSFILGNRQGDNFNATRCVVVFVVVVVILVLFDTSG